jgi:hypothetical protein
MPQSVAAGLAATAILALPLAATPARAQLMDQLKSAVQGGGGNGGAGGLMGGLPSVAQASPSNTAGVLQYCMRNNYLNASAASSLKDSLLGKVNGSGQHANDSAFKAGNNGQLETGNDQNFSLSGSGLKQEIAHKVCDLVLQHAKSLL